MSPKFISVLGLNIAYYEKAGTTGTILFIHGNSGDAANFRLMWVDPALAAFHLVAIDLPGHGKSARSSNTDSYQVLSSSKFAAALIDKLNLNNVVVVGHSLGGHVAVHAAQYSNRVAGVMVIGSAPIAKGEDIANAYLLNEDLTVLFNHSATMEQLLKAVDISLHNKTHKQFFLDSYALADGKCRETTGADLGVFANSVEFRSEVGILNGVKAALVVGEFEGLANQAYIENLPISARWGGRVHKVKGAGHCPPYESPEATAKLTAQFAAFVSKR